MRHIIYLIFLFTTLFSCSSETKKTTEKEAEKETNEVVLTDAQLKNTELKIGQIQHQSMASLLTLNGTIDLPPQNLVSVSIPFGGYLKSTTLLPGMHIQKGETIAYVEDQQYVQLQQEYLTSKTKENFLAKEYERQRELNANKASSDKTFQQVEADYMMQKITTASFAEKLKLLGLNPSTLNEKNISKTVAIKSTINGYVAKINSNIGKYLSPTDVLVELVNPADVHLRLLVYEKDLQYIKVGQQVKAYTNNNPSKKMDAEIILIGKSVNEDKTVEVHCHFKQYDHSLIPGLFMNAEIKIEQKNANTVPESAVLFFEGKHYVFVQKDKTVFDLEEVEIGATENNAVEILSNNISNQNIVLEGAYTLLMKLKNTEEE